MIYYLLVILLSVTPPSVFSADVTKICGNEDCSEILYTASATRSYVSNHEGFLSLNINDPLKIYAIKFSNRVDIIEGATESGQRGLIYKSHVDPESLVFWLFSTVKQNQNVYEVLSSAQPGLPKPLKVKQSNPFLLRDYIVNAKNANMDVEEITELEDPEKAKKGHHHHHHHGHDHSHEHHDHSHEHHDHPPPLTPTTTAAPPVASEPITTPPPATPQPIAAADPLKKISLDAMAKGGNIPPPPQPVKTPQSGTVDDLKKQQIAAAVAASAAAQKQLNAAKIAAAQAEAAQKQALEAEQRVKILELNTITENANKAEQIPIQEASIPVEPIPTPAINVNVPPPPVPVETPPPAVPESVQPTPDIYNSIIDTIEQLPSTPPTPIVIPTSVESVPVVTPAPIENVPTPVPLPVEIPTPAPIPVEIPTPAPIPVEIPTLAPIPVDIPLPPVVTPPPVVEEIPVVTTPLPIVEEIPIVTTTPATIEILETTTTPPLPLEPEGVVTPASVPEPAVKPDTIPNDDEVRQRRSALQDGIDKPDDFCYNNDCSDRVAVATEAPLPHDPAYRPVNTGFIATNIRPTFKSVSIAIRSTFPYPISHFDDTGVFVLLFLVFATIAWFIGWLFADSSRQDVLDRRALHDALTRIKEQEVQMQQLKANASDPAIIGQYTREIERLRHENASLLAKVNDAAESSKRIEAELIEANSERTTYQAEVQKTNSEKAVLQNKYDSAAAELSHLQNELNMIRQQLEESNTRQADYIAELQDSRKLLGVAETALSEATHAKSALEIDLDNLKSTTDALEKQLEAKNHSDNEFIALVVELKEQKEVLEQQVAAFEKQTTIPVVDSAGTGSGESNTSNGWSDMDDFNAHDEFALTKSADETIEAEETVKPKKPAKVATLGKKEKVVKPPSPKESSPEVEQTQKTSPRPSVASIEAVMEMKALRDVKVERDNLKRELANEQRLRENVETALEELKKTLAEKKAELEKANSNSDNFCTMNQTLSQQNADMFRKIERLDEERAKIAELEKTIIALTSEKAEFSNKIKDLERALRKADERTENVERQRYVDERRLKDKIADLEVLLSKAKQVEPPLLNDGIASGNSSDRDFSLTNVSSAASPLQSLWDDVNDAETSFDSSLPVNSTRRRSDRYLPPVEPSGRRSAGRRPEGHSSTQHRYRSRSAGRQRYPAPTSPYAGGVSNGSAHHLSRTSPLYDDHERDRTIGTSAADLRHRRSHNGRRSTNFVYSSDGSGACSPPPELTSVSGVPPATIKIHKPAPKK